MSKVGLLAIGVTLCAGQTFLGEQSIPPQEVESALVAGVLSRVRHEATAFTQQLLQELKEALTASGPEGAIQVCSVKAQEIARAHSVEGMTLRRVSLAARNPDNRPDGFEDEKLRAMAEKAAAGEEVSEVWEVVEERKQKTLRYMRPIFVGELCLRCHGPREKLEPSVQELLAELYPEDEAVGYKAGDFRGAVSVIVEVKMNKSPEP